VLAILILSALCARAQEPGVVVLAGEGATVDAATCAELGGARRVLLAPGNAAEAFDPLSASPAPAVRLGLDPAAFRPGDAREPAELARSSACVVLSGGAYMDWYRILTPGGSTTRLSDAIREAHSAGVTVVGAGAAAPFLAQWSMVDRASLGKRPRNPRRVREDVAAAGLGLVENLLVDTSARPRGDPARMLRAAFDGSVDLALFLDGPAVWIARPRARVADVRGTGTAFVFDLAAARRLRGAWREGRLSMLSEGGAWTARRRCECGEPTEDLHAEDTRSERLRSSLERASARLSITTDERTHVSKAGACELLFDLEWDER
jgi:hypothetical protein